METTKCAEATAQIKAADPEMVTARQVREWAVTAYAGWNEWYHSMHWSKDEAEFLAQIEAEAAHAAQAMQAKIEELEARAEAAANLRLLLAFRRVNRELEELRKEAT